MNNEKQRGKKSKGLFFMGTGLLLILAAFFLVIYNWQDGQRAGKAARQMAEQLQEAVTVQAAADVSEDQEEMLPDYMLCPDMEMPVKTIEGVDYIGILTIPALELELPVISEWSYPNLKIAPCRYGGSAYLNNLIICGHNYRSHFGNLKHLTVGDLAFFTDTDGNVFTYKMVGQETLSKTSAEAMESGEWDLTLFTCTVGGKNRVTIRFRLEQN